MGGFRPLAGFTKPAKALMESEPARTVGGAVGLVAAVIACLVAFGVDLTVEQQTAILGLTSVAAPILSGFITRAFVSPSGKRVKRDETD